ncbi:hypothetical protein I302_103944 [Kwoniella bestiolae CBS 10118]|uniref:Myb-like domain-containing protein n=1 Tax=Kwoniella bestiolae CBS 10118 TaxID=1296100 RepID=A0A1B9G9X1_9TREE|nr:hypothetical protein I302_02650 [Kwoniella bestiolae CBS 10118]OCF27801.1 hypothetical protein I302_02650 [Kwoniella bestiolae CBS 10118]
MPRQVMNTSNLPLTKPYNRSSTPMIDIKPDIQNTEIPNSTPRKEKAKRDVSTSRKWTSEELIQLFEHVSKNGTKRWENAVPGRTGNQSYQTWLQSLSPFIKRSIAGKGRSTKS